MNRKLNIKERTLQFMKRNKKLTDKHTLIATIVCVISLVSLYLTCYVKHNTAFTVSVTKDDTTQLIATFVGDISFEDNFYKALENKEEHELIKYVENIFNSSDYITGGMDGPSLGYEKTAAINGKNINKIMDESVQFMKTMNFSVVSMTNDERLINDPGRLARKMDLLNAVGIDSVGAGLNLNNAKRISYRQINGLNIATLGFSDVANRDVRALNDRAGILFASPLIYFPLIEEAKNNADLVIVHMNWGSKYSTHVSDNQKILARAISDAGADIIVGHNSHVAQPIEFYKKSLILYNLGNVFTGEGFSLTKESVFCQYILNRDGTARIEIIPISITNAQPKPMGGITGWVKRRGLFYHITREVPEDVSRMVEGDKLILQVKDHDIKGDFNNGL